MQHRRADNDELAGRNSTALATDRREATQLRRELAASEARFHAIVHKTADGVIVLLADGTIKFVNPAVEAILGRKSGELIGEAFGVPLVPDGTTEVDIHPRGGPARIAEMRVVHTEWYGRPAYLATLRDITEHKKAEQKARQAVRRRDQFLATLSHELRNPLAAIVSAAKILRRIGTSDHSRRQAREVIGRQSDYMTRMLDQLLDVSRVSQDKIELRRESVDLQSVATGAVQAIRLSGAFQDHKLRIQQPDQPLYVNGDPARLHQVLVNLLTNSAKYTDPGGHIALRLSAESGEAVLDVSDNGIGISLELMDSLFEPFVQGNNTKARSEGGMGIGLALVRHLVELHGGKVSAHSKGPGHGSRFVVRLPLATKVAAAPPQPRQQLSQTKLQIVLVEDNADVAEMLSSLLGFEGHTVSVAHNGEQGVKMVESLRPDAALVDIGLPVMNGLQVARRLRSNPKNAPVFLVALTGYGQAADHQQALKAGFDAHLVKPVDMDELMRLLRERAE